MTLSSPWAAVLTSSVRCFPADGCFRLLPIVPVVEGNIVAYVETGESSIFMLLRLLVEVKGNEDKEEEESSIAT